MKSKISISFLVPTSIAVLLTILVALSELSLETYAKSSIPTEARVSGRGFGDKIDWVTLDYAKKHSSEKPIMILVHKTWCGACKRLKPIVAASKKIQKLSKHFHMVNLENKEEPEEPQFKPDGGYVPRILFTDKSGKINPKVMNPRRQTKHKFFYPGVDEIVEGMNKAVTFWDAKSKTEL